MDSQKNIPDDIIEYILQISTLPSIFKYGVDHSFGISEVIGIFPGWVHNDTFECFVDEEWIAQTKPFSSFDGNQPCGSEWTTVYRDGDLLYYVVIMQISLNDFWIYDEETWYTEDGWDYDLIKIGQLIHKSHSPRIRRIAKQFASFGTPTIFNCQFMLDTKIQGKMRTAVEKDIKL